MEYRIGKAADKEEYTLKSSQRPEYFRLPAYATKPLIAAAQRDTLAASATSDPALTAAQTPKQ